DITAIVTHLGVFGGFDLDEGSPGESGEAAGNLCLAHARGAHHENVFGSHFLTKFVSQLLPPPAIANGDRHRPLGRPLADDVTIEFFDDLPRCQVAHFSSSTMISWLEYT